MPWLSSIGWLWAFCCVCGQPVRSRCLAASGRWIWQLNETNGTIAFDSSGNGNNGLYEPGVTLDEAGVPDPPFVGIATNNLAAGFTDYAQDSNYCYQNQKLKCLVTMALGF